ncbi:MAG: DUF1501 domain-containing protein, partial [Planctomycetales bacterium]|nr:DUF1501 domain-containing protein [Planctomycetales bacterium]
MNLYDTIQQHSRRQLLTGSARVLGTAALATLMGKTRASAATAEPANSNTGLPDLPHFAPKAKRVIYMFMSGGPSHIDTFDYKPAVRKIHGQELPDSIRNGQRITTMTSGQQSFPCVAPMFNFKQYGSNGTWVSEILPHTASIIDEIAIVKSLHTEAINHDPAITYINTGSQQPGKPSMGAWLSYGLGSANQNLPSFVVMISRGRGNLQALYSRLWGSGFLPSKHQGVKFRSGAEPVLYLQNPDGIDPETRRRMLDSVSQINQQHHEEFFDPETLTRISQYEMAYRMQTSVPDLMDLSDESEQTFELYGDASKKGGTFARNCIIARRLAERGVPFIQLYHRGWDQHGNLPTNIRNQCNDIDQPAAGLVKDLKQRGMLDDTLVVWGGEFGRTIYSQGTLSPTNHGRDHHGRCFTSWMAGGGIKPGVEFGKTDDYCYN